MNRLHRSGAIAQGLRARATVLSVWPHVSQCNYPIAMNNGTRGDPSDALIEMRLV